MQKLHLVGFTAEFDGLIFSTRKGARSGSFVVPLDARLLKQIADAERRRDGGDLRTASVLESRVAPKAERPESALTPREMQDRLRGGWTLDEVAREAGVDAEWVARFAAPVLAEIGRVVDRARGLVFDKPRFGESSLPLGASVRRNVAERGVALTDDEIDDAWNAWQAGDDLWVVRFAYRSRGREQEAEWLLDLADDELTARNRLASQLGHVGRAKGRTRQPSSVPKRPTPARSPRATKSPARRAAVKKALATTAPAKRTTARAATAKKAAARKAAAKKAAARKAPAKKATVRTAPAKKATVRKAPAKKATARTAPAKKATVRTVPAKKATARAAPARKATHAATASRAATRKAPAKKATAGRPAARRTSAGQRSSGRSSPSSAARARTAAGRSARAASPRAAEKAPAAPDRRLDAASPGAWAPGAAEARPGTGRPPERRRPQPAFEHVPVAPAPRPEPAPHPEVAAAPDPRPGPAATAGRPARQDGGPPAEANGTRRPPPDPAFDTGPRRILFDDLAGGDDPAAPWGAEPRGPLPPPPPMPVPEQVREAVASPIGDPELEPPVPGPTEVDEETGIARIDSRRTSRYVSAPPPRQPVFRQDVTRAAPAEPPAPRPQPGPRPRRRSEPLRGR